jgi:hypothetical protein
VGNADHDSANAPDRFGAAVKNVNSGVLAAIGV